MDTLKNNKINIYFIKGTIFHNFKIILLIYNKLHKTKLRNKVKVLSIKLKNFIFNFVIFYINSI